LATRAGRLSRMLLEWGMNVLGSQESPSRRVTNSNQTDPTPTFQLPPCRPRKASQTRPWESVARRGKQGATPPRERICCPSPACALLPFFARGLTPVLKTPLSNPLPPTAALTSGGV